MKTFQVEYINFKGIRKVDYIYANNLDEAKQSAKTLQGLFKVIDINEV